MSVPLPRVLCRGWDASDGKHIRCVSPVIQTGEPGGEERSGICALCLEFGKRAAERKWRREGRQLLRDRAKTYGPQAGDPFENMREPGVEKTRG